MRKAIIIGGLPGTKVGNTTQAMADLSKSIELEPGLAQAYYNRGIVYDKQGRFIDAINDFSKAIN